MSFDCFFDPYKLPNLSIYDGLPQTYITSENIANDLMRLNNNVISSDNPKKTISYTIGNALDNESVLAIVQLINEHVVQPNYLRTSSPLETTDIEDFLPKKKQKITHINESFGSILCTIEVMFLNKSLNKESDEKNNHIKKLF